jgi:hypothetical protein
MRNIALKSVRPGKLLCAEFQTADKMSVGRTGHRAVLQH